MMVQDTMKKYWGISERKLRPNEAPSADSQNGLGSLPANSYAYSSC